MWLEKACRRHPATSSFVIGRLQTGHEQALLPQHLGQRSRSFFIRSRILWPAPQSTACNASPSAPFNGFRSSRPSVFMCPIVGSMALRRLIMAFSPRVTPRRWPDRKIWTPSTTTPWYPRSTMTVFGILSSRMLAFYTVSANVPIPWVTGHWSHSHHEAFHECGGHSHFHAKFVWGPCLAVREEHAINPAAK